MWPLVVHAALPLWTLHCSCLRQPFLLPNASCFIDCWQAQHSTHFQDTLRRNSEPLMEEQPQRQQVAMQRHPQVTV